MRAFLLKQLNLLKLLALTSYLMIIFGMTHAYAGEGSPFNQIIFFGDSLSDNGNLYSYDFGFLPKSPPYYQGRFSNGRVWSEYFADYYLNHYRIASANYAYGGETAVLHSPFDGYAPYSFTASLDSYLLRNIFESKENILFVIWIGANDYLNGATDVEGTTSSIVQNIKDNIDRLIYYGAKNFLVINIPDLSKTPFAISSSADVSKNLLNLTNAHNAKLKVAIDELQNNYKQANIQLYNVNQLLTQVLNDLASYNAKYQSKLSNFTNSCWQGGYSFNKTLAYSQKAVPLKISEEVIKTQLEAYRETQNKIPQKHLMMSKASANKQDTKMLAHYIATNQALLEAYQTSEKAERGSGRPCSLPETFIFWDSIHPTTAAHNIIAQEIIAFANQRYRHI